MLLTALLLATLWSLLIALAIEHTAFGRAIAGHLTALTVIVGVLGDLGVMLLLTDEAGRVPLLHVLYIFIASGIPVTVQNLSRFTRYMQGLMDDAHEQDPTGE